MTTPYDPVKAHDYYERHKQLKGRQPGIVNSIESPQSTVQRLGSTRIAAKPIRKPITPVEFKQRAQARVVRLTAKVSALTKALTEAEGALRTRRGKGIEVAHSSNGKTATKSIGPKSVSEMSENELTDRISKIKGLISEAKKQIQNANALAHSFSSSEFISHSGPMTVNTN